MVPDSGSGVAVGDGDGDGDGSGVAVGVWLGVGDGDAVVAAGAFVHPAISPINSTNTRASESSFVVFMVPS